MLRACVALAALSSAAAAAAAPVYSAEGIVNAGDYSPGPFAPNSILTIFGSGLAWSERALTAGDIQGRTLPTKLNNTQVFVDDSPVALFYVSGGQVNFLVPATEVPGDATVRVVREGVTGPNVTITLADAAPALFEAPPGYVLVTHADNTLVTADSPAHPLEIVVVYATGLGKTAPNPAAGEIPQYAAVLFGMSALKVYLGGSAVAPDRIQYAGLSPGSAGLYQVNLALPDGLDADPELRVAIGDQSSRPGLKIALH